VAVRAFAPFGALRPFPADSGEPVEPFADEAGARVRELAAGCALVIVSVDGADVAELDRAVVDRCFAGPGPPARLAWHAVGVPVDGQETVAAMIGAAPAAERISMLDDGSPARWTARGGTEPASAVEHPAVLSARIFAPELLDARREFLRAIDAWPNAGRPIVVQGGPSDLAHVTAVVDAIGRQPVVALIADGGDHSFADAFVAASDCERRLPTDAGAEDRVAAIAGADAIIAGSPVVRAVADAFGVPNASMEDCAPATSTRVSDIVAAPAPVTDAARRLDDDFDALAALVPDRGPGPLAWSELQAARAALDARARRMVSERVAMADRVRTARERVAFLEQQVAALDAAYRDVRNLEVVRLRVALGELRARLRRPRRR
jgi:hypothetical protein